DPRREPYPRAASAPGVPRLNLTRGIVQPLLQRADQELTDVDPELLVQLTDAGRTGDVDLGDEAADDIQTHEQHAAGGQRRPDLARQPPIAVIERPADTAGAGGEIAAMIGSAGDAGEGVGDRLAV